MLTGVTLFLVVFIALLAIPVTLTYQVSWRRTFEGRVTLQWLFGLVRIQLSSKESKSPALEPEKSAQRKRKQVPSGKKSSPVAAFRHKYFRQRVFRFIRDFWHAVQTQNMKLRFRIGLGDPAETGQLWAIVGPVSGMLATIQGASIEIEPEFIEPVFELDSSGNVRIIPLQMIYLTIGLVLSPAIWQGIKQMRQAG